MEQVTFEGTTWNKAGIGQATQAEFVAAHMADEGTYSTLSPEKKEQALKLAYVEMFGEPQPVAIPTKSETKKTVISPSTAEGAE